MEPGTFVEIAERKRNRAANAEQSGFLSGRKQGQYVSATNMVPSNQVYYGRTSDDFGDDQHDDDDDHDNHNKTMGHILLPPRPEVQDKTITPTVMEWWDLMELVPSKWKKQVVAYEGKLWNQSQVQSNWLTSSDKKQQQQQDVTTNTTTTTTTTTGNNHTTEDNKDKNDDSQVNSSSNTSSSMIQELQHLLYQQAALSYSKTAALIQHIVPIQPPHVKPQQPVLPTLYLTKRERKRQRKLRRQEKQRELQDLQAAGLVPPPEPRLTLSNFIRVLGDQAWIDPSQMEQRVMEQIQARQRAHLERNAATKLTKAQRAAKYQKKYTEDTSKTGIYVALFYVKDMSHPYHRTKVDLNAQQWHVTGGVVETPQVSCIICEGGPKAIQRYTRLLLVRMKWTGPESAEEQALLLQQQEEEELRQQQLVRLKQQQQQQQQVAESTGTDPSMTGDDDDDKNKNNTSASMEDNGDAEEWKPLYHPFNTNNKCELVWTGMATKRFFKGFVFQSCETSEEARKILHAKGVGHFWDQVLNYASGRGDKVLLKLTHSDNDGDDDDDDNEDESNDDEENDKTENKDDAEQRPEDKGKNNTYDRANQSEDEDMEDA